MSAGSHTTINIARLDGFNQRASPQYRHYFRVNLDESPGDYTAQEVVADLKRKYPAPGFKVTVTYWRCVGHPVNEKGEWQ